MMKKFTPIFAASLLCAGVHSAPAQASSCDTDAVMVSATGPSAVNTYEVLRKGKPIGEHVISFFPSAHGIKILAETEMKVEVLFITAFKYTYRSEEVYCGGQLQSSMTHINNNGKDIDVTIMREEEAYMSDGGKGFTQVTRPFYTSNHWTMDGLDTSDIMNTATGGLDSVKITPAGAFDGGTEYHVRGDIDYDTRYSPDGHWLGMTFEHPKGGTIEFRCKDCRNTPLRDDAVSRGVNPEL